MSSKVVRNPQVSAKQKKENRAAKRKRILAGVIAGILAGAMVIGTIIGALAGIM